MVEVVKHLEHLGENDYVRIFLDKVGRGFLVRYEGFSYEEKDGEKIEVVWHEFPITLPYVLLKEGEKYRLFKLKRVPIDEFGEGSLPEDCYLDGDKIKVEFEISQRWQSELVTVEGHYVRDIKKEEVESFLKEILEKEVINDE